MSQDNNEELKAMEGAISSEESTNDEGNDIVTIDPNKIENIKKDKLRVSKDNPRKNFREQNINKLKEDIIKNGIITPLVVYKKKETDDKYIIADGECRYKACLQIPEVIEVPCVIVDAETGKEWTAKSVFMREDLNPIEKSNALWKYIQIVDNEACFNEKGRFKSKITGKDYCNQLGIKLASTFTELVSFKKLPDDIRKEQEETGLIPQRDLRVLARGACAKDESKMRAKYEKLKAHFKKLEDEKKAAQKKVKDASTSRGDLKIQGVRNRITQTKEYYEGVNFEKLDTATQKIQMKEAYEQVLVDIEALKKVCNQKIAELDKLIVEAPQATDTQEQA